MDYLSEKDLSLFFEQNNNLYTNSTGMQIGLLAEWGVWTLLEVSNHENSSMAVHISTEEDSLQDFIVGFRIEGWRDIDQLDYNSSWMRYLNGSATITVNPMELEADISFKIVKSKTIIFSMDMHFYDEYNKHLSMPDDFRKYIEEHERRLWAANENRYRISR
ncbi:MAG: hypothetical protein HC819_16660 [Cyclobacteriaceae bacterium]|nr:hypothetical protein [Cyclobacteriaceae bacterium]